MRCERCGGLMVHNEPLVTAYFQTKMDRCLNCGFVRLHERLDLLDEQSCKHDHRD